MNYPGSAFEIGVGLEVDLERVMKGFSVEGGLAFSPKASSENVDGNSIYRYEKGRITFTLGAVKRLGNGKIFPIVRGGGFVVSHFGTEEIRGWRVSEKYPYHYSAPNTWANTTHWGVYLGAGVQMAVGKHFARLHGDWYKSIEPSSLGNMMKWGVTAEFGL